jgi:hypothetical protein
MEWVSCTDWVSTSSQLVISVVVKELFVFVCSQWKCLGRLKYWLVYWHKKEEHMRSNPHIMSPQPYPLSYQASPAKPIYTAAFPVGKLLKHIFRKLRPTEQKGKTGVSLFPSTYHWSHFCWNPQPKSDNLSLLVKCMMFFFSYVKYICVCQSLFQ